MEDGDGNGSGAVLAGDWRWKDNGPESMGNPELGVGGRGPWLLIYTGPWGLGVVWRAGYQEARKMKLSF